MKQVFINVAQYLTIATQVGVKKIKFQLET